MSLSSPHRAHPGSLNADLEHPVEPIRSWVKRADIDDGMRPGVTTSDSERLKDLEQEVQELPRANEILRRAATFFGAELDRQQGR